MTIKCWHVIYLVQSFKHTFGYTIFDRSNKLTAATHTLLKIISIKSDSSDQWSGTSGAPGPCSVYVSTCRQAHVTNFHAGFVSLASLTARKLGGEHKLELLKHSGRIQLPTESRMYEQILYLYNANTVGPRPVVVTVSQYEDQD